MLAEVPVGKLYTILAWHRKLVARVRRLQTSASIRRPLRFHRASRMPRENTGRGIIGSSARWRTSVIAVGSDRITDAYDAIDMC